MKNFHHEIFIKESSSSPSGSPPYIKFQPAPNTPLSYNCKNLPLDSFYPVGFQFARLENGNVSPENTFFELAKRPAGFVNAFLDLKPYVGKWGVYQPVHIHTVPFPIRGNSHFYLASFCLVDEKLKISLVGKLGNAPVKNVDLKDVQPLGTMFSLFTDGQNELWQKLTDNFPLITRKIKNWNRKVSGRGIDSFVHTAPIENDDHSYVSEFIITGISGVQ